ncbi:winged helix-turn-helix DNA-binding domain, heat shock transcription factor family protein [Tanacetum coccineum]
MLRHVSLEERPIVVLGLRGGLLGANPIPRRLARVVQFDTSLSSLAQSLIISLWFDPVDCHDYPSHGYHGISCVDYIPHLHSVSLVCILCLFERCVEKPYTVQRSVQRIDVEETMLASDISEGFSSGDDEGLLAEPTIRGVHNGALPPLVNKLYNTVCNKESDSIISWVPNLNVSDGAKSFAIWNIDEFINNVLPLMSKSNNFDSFITQLHNYVRILRAYGVTARAPRRG